MKIFILPDKITRIAILCTLLITIINAIVQVIKYGLSYKRGASLQAIFDVGHDGNLPTWYASITLLFCAILLAVIAKVKAEKRDKYSRHWQGLAIVFVFLSIDEVAMLHEKAGDLLEKLPFEYTGLFNYQWVILGIPLTLIFVLSYLRFLFALPNKISFLLALAGAIFVSGSLGVEMLAANYESLYGYDNLIYNMLTAVEEFLEMLGIVVFIHTLLLYIETYVKGLEISIGKRLQQ